VAFVKTYIHHGSTLIKFRNMRILTVSTHILKVHVLCQVMSPFSVLIFYFKPVICKLTTILLLAAQHQSCNPVMVAHWHQ